MATIRVRSRLATTHAIPAYGGVQLDEHVMYDLAAAVSDGAMPMHFNHDISRPVVVSNVQAGVERLPDGELAAWAEYDVDADVWSKWEAEREAARAPGGMSISFTTPLEDGDLAPDDAPAVIAADASHFNDELIKAAAARLSALGVPAAPQRLYQFSFDPLVKVVVDLAEATVLGMPGNLLANYLYDSLRVFVQRGRPTIFNVSVRITKRRRKVKVHLAVPDDAALERALTALPEVLRSATGTVTYDPDTGAYAEVAGADNPPIIEGPAGHDPESPGQ